MVPVINPITVPADWSITPSPPQIAMASRMPQPSTSRNQTTGVTFPVDSVSVVETNAIDFPVTTVVIPIIVGLLVLILIILGSTLIWARTKRAATTIQDVPSASTENEKESKSEALKTMSNITTSSVDDDENAISLTHWASKKAVSNRYESWHIGEIDQEWVRIIKNLTAQLNCIFSMNFLNLLIIK